MLCSARTRVATAGSVASRWIERSATLTQSSTASAWVAATRVSVRATLATLPAASVIVSEIAFAPVARETPGNWNVPPAPTSADRPWPGSATVAPSSAVPRSVTIAAAVCDTSPPAASTDVMPKAAPVGVCVSSTNATVRSTLALPAASLAVMPTLWAPSASTPPARASSVARSSVKLPSDCSFALRSTATPASSETSSRVTPTSSRALPTTDALRVMPSDDDRPVSTASAALTVGAVVSPVAAWRVRLAVAVDVLPAVSAAVSTNALAPMSSAMPGREKLPSFAAVAVAIAVALPLRRSVSVVPASARPSSVTGFTVVVPSPTVPLSLPAARPNAAIDGGVMSNVNGTSAVVELPATSRARTRTVCAASVSMVPGDWESSCPSVIVNEPSGCSADVTSTYAPLSSEKASCAMPPASDAVPRIVGSCVTPSAVDAPVSLPSAAANVGGVASAGRSRTSESVALPALPLASSSASVKSLPPSASATPANEKPPLPAAVAVSRTVDEPARRSVSAAPASAMPSSVTTEALVWPSPTLPVSLAAASPNAVATGATESSVNASAIVVALPAASRARSVSVCGPCASVAPASVSSVARGSVNAPPAPMAEVTSVQTGTPAASSAASSATTARSSETVPVTATSLVMPSTAPVSLASAAESVGALVSGISSRVIVSALGADVLPAASAAVSSKPLAPSASARFANENLPFVPAVAVATTAALPVRRSASAAPASATPSSVTTAAVVRPSPGVPVSLAAASTKLAIVGATRSTGTPENAVTVDGLVAWPAIFTEVGNCGATMDDAPRMRPPTTSSCSRCTVVPTWRSLPSPRRPSTGSTLTSSVVSTMSPVMRTRASVPAAKRSPLAPVPPSDASSPKSAPTIRCSPRVDPPTCSSCSEASAMSPEASPWTTICTTVDEKFARHAAAVEPAVMELVRPWTLHSPPLIAPPICAVPSV